MNSFKEIKLVSLKFIIYDDLLTIFKTCLENNISYTAIDNTIDINIKDLIKIYLLLDNSNCKNSEILKKKIALKMGEVINEI